MSTKERYGTYVYRAILDSSYNATTGMRKLVSVGEVAKWAQVSQPTAKKYLMHLVRMNVVAKFPVGNRWVYQYIGDGLDI